MRRIDDEDEDEENDKRDLQEDIICGNGLLEDEMRDGGIIG